MSTLKTLFLSIPLVFMIALIACQRQEDHASSTESSPKVESAQHPPYLRLPYDGMISTLDPSMVLDMGSIELAEQLFLGLTDFDPKTYEVVPELAKEWTVNAEGTLYTFTLREDVRWTNGEPVTAHDVVWTIQRNIFPATQSPYAYTLYILKNAEAINTGQLYDAVSLGVRALDEYTIEFALEHPAAYFPAMASLWTYRPLPRKTIEQYGQAWSEVKNIQTNGAYQVAEFKKGYRLILKKNPNYYEADKVSIPEVHYYIILENSLGLTMYENNELDIMGGEAFLRIPLTEIPRIESDYVLRQQIHTEPQFCTQYYGFNTKKPPMDNVLVRKAISAAIDRQLLIDVIVKGHQMPAHTFTRPPIFGSVDPSENVGISFDPNQAQKWLAEAGYPNGKDFPKITLLHNTSEFHGAIAQAIQTLLKYYLNIDIDIQSEDFDNYIKAQKQPNTPHVFRAGWCSDYPDANNWLYENFHSEKSPNLIGWHNGEFDDSVDLAQKIQNPEKRKKLYRRAEQILTEEEAAIMPLYFDTAQYLVKPWVKEWYGMALGGQKIHHWSLEK
jgi:oligopeptide transport system substrate-binding protein